MSASDRHANVAGMNSAYRVSRSGRRPVARQCTLSHVSSSRNSAIGSHGTVRACWP